MFLSYKFVKSRFPPHRKSAKFPPPPLTSPSGGGNLVPPHQIFQRENPVAGSCEAVKEEIWNFWLIRQLLANSPLTGEFAKDLAFFPRLYIIGMKIVKIRKCIFTFKHDEFWLWILDQPFCIFDTRPYLASLNAALLTK